LTEEYTSNGRSGLDETPSAHPHSSQGRLPSSEAAEGQGGEVSHRWAVVPVKSFDWAKSRLEGVLSLTERRELARNLMRHAVTALVESCCFDRIVVVSRDEEALAFARELGAEAMPEQGPPGLNAALRGARDVAIKEGASSVLVLFSDLPRVTAADICALVDASTKSRIVIGPDRRDEGTNALLLSPPDAIDFAFGVDSFPKHMAACERAALDVVVMRLEGIGSDVDLPADLAGLGPETAAVESLRVDST